MPLSGATYAERVSSHDSTAKAHILIAEDDPGVRTSLTRALTFQGYEVTAVNDGSQALESVTRSLPDAVILDVSMPHIDGLTACRMIREKHRHLPILMLTARHEVSDRVAGLDAGADDYVVKPFALEELSAHVKARLAAYKAPRHLVVIDSIGRAPNGKVDYKRLKTVALERLGVAP